MYYTNVRKHLHTDVDFDGSSYLLCVDYILEHFGAFLHILVLLCRLTSSYDNVVSSAALVAGEGWEEPPPAACGVGGVRREQVTPLTAQVGVSPVVGHTPTAHLDKNKGRRFYIMEVGGGQQNKLWGGGLISERNRKRE